ncbi:envelope stress response membrane protein PspC [Photobacterium phosphoreum]|uniref:envelope stress response membrane protein PspC n=1 Tax=Photobacterium phosphoreum TaxID=659 RepID=UPI000D16DCB0|nr:envelope stress response membrane protein PspC [Photobacterium phosphoreum]PSU71833.1 envelope stress response membrane protein PspC [Photobacterium phosphoreum]PSW31781.1 envelope stress response membrane protein PspC [Photobacterium phosphoreum]PTB33963.1 envelope stress response membrane protein PspC [Photobacterium phosphoreum]
MRKTLYRDPKNGKLGGVCAGLAEYFGVEIWLMRILAVTAFLLGVGFFATVAYIAAWLILDKMPPQRKEQQHQYAEHNVKQKPWQTGQSAQQILHNVETELARSEASIQKMEAYVTSSAFKVDREFNKL